MSSFKIGQLAKRIYGACFDSKHGGGFVGRIVAIEYDGGEVLVFDNGDKGYAEFYVPFPENSSPVRTETRKVIVPGVYGVVDVSNVTASDVTVHLINGSIGIGLTAPELRAAATVLTQLAEALESNK